MKVTIVKPQFEGVGNPLPLVAYNAICPALIFYLKTASFSCFGVCFEVENWRVFLSSLWRIYAEFSKTSAGSLVSVPIRVCLNEYNAYTDVRFDADCGGIRYTSLERYDSRG